MQFLKSRFSWKDVSLYFACLTFLLLIVAVIVYPLTAANEFNPNISVQLIVMLIVAAVVEVASIFLPFKELRAVGFFLVLYDTIIYAGTQGNYLANLLVSIDGSKPSASLIGMLIILVVSIVASLLSFILLREKKASKQPEAAKEGE